MGNLKFARGARIFIGVSGGLDSVVLLHMLRDQQPIILHVNHQLQAESSQWESFVVNLAKDYGFPCEVKRLDPQIFATENVEAKARKARYDFFEQYLTGLEDILFLAHHEQDQVETFFLNLQRGSGLAGLTAMPRERPFGQGKLLRPLLETSRQELKAYAKTHDLQWVEDPSNQETSLNRNFLRKEVLPLLRERFPHFDRHVGRSIVHLQAAREVLEGYLAEDLLSLGNPLDLKVWERMPYHKKSLLLQAWIKQYRDKILSEKQLEVIVKEVIGAAPDRHPCFEIPGLRIERKKHKLILA